MIVFRAAMGYAGGTFLVRGQTAINLAFAGVNRFKALFVFAIGVVGIARLCGAAVGGYLTECYSGRDIFLLNVPMALGALALLAVALPDLKARLSERARR